VSDQIFLDQMPAGFGLESVMPGNNEGEFVVQLLNDDTGERMEAVVFLAGGVWLDDNSLEPGALSSMLRIFGEVYWQVFFACKQHLNESPPRE
jgi:NADH:ubiquinone oxidoreductase subunit D